MDRNAYQMLIAFNRETKKLDDVYRSAAKSCGISECAFWILYTLRVEEKSFTQAEICEFLIEPKQTVNSALKKLEAEGYLYTREKRGYYVADVERHPAAPGRAPARSAPQPQRSWLLDLSSGGSGTEDFPFSVWAKLMRRVLSEEGEALLRATPPNGVPSS